MEERTCKENKLNFDLAADRFRRLNGYYHHHHCHLTKATCIDYQRANDFERIDEQRDLFF